MKLFVKTYRSVTSVRSSFETGARKLKPAFFAKARKRDSIKCHHGDLFLSPPSASCPTLNDMMATGLIVSSDLPVVAVSTSIEHQEGIGSVARNEFETDSFTGLAQGKTSGCIDLYK